MKASTVQSDWLPKGGYRLDCSPYLGGAIETEILLENLPVRKDTLGSVTTAIFNGPKFSRTYVDHPDLGVPFLGGSALQQTDLSNLPLLSKKQATSHQLSHLEIKRGMSLITCSGTIGKMAYARPDMEGIWSSQHIMKVVPDEESIPPGYLYSFLSSKFGVPLVVSGTYGSIIQSIEPHHIAGLSVPRFGDALEHEIHELVEDAARCLCEKTAMLEQATSLFFDSLGLKDVSSFEWGQQRHLDLGFSFKGDVAFSLRTLGFSPRVRNLISTIKAGPWRALGEICANGSLVRGSRFSRIDASSEYGTRMIGQRDLFCLRPEGRIVARSVLPGDAFVFDGAILIAAQGTLGEKELYCRAQFITDNWVEFAYSEHVLKVIANESIMPRGCLFAFLRSETAFRMLRSTSSGTKLQDHNYFLLPRLPVPMPPREVHQRVDSIVRSAYEMMHTAVSMEDRAVSLVESAILNR